MKLLLYTYSVWRFFSYTTPLTSLKEFFHVDIPYIFTRIFLAKQRCIALAALKSSSSYSSSLILDFAISPVLLEEGINFSLKASCSSNWINIFLAYICYKPKLILSLNFSTTNLMLFDDLTPDISAARTRSSNTSCWENYLSKYRHYQLVTSHINNISYIWTVLCRWIVIYTSNLLKF